MSDDQKTDHHIEIQKSSEPAKADLSTYCPQCGSQLRDARCKLVCETCGFFLSSAIFTSRRDNSLMLKLPARMESLQTAD